MKKFYLFIKYGIVSCLFSVVLNPVVWSQGITPNFSFGLRGGINTSIAYGIEPFSILSNFDGSPSEKKYQSFEKNLGANFGALVYYNLANGLKIGFLPTFTTYNYGYNSAYAWAGSANTTYDIAFSQLSSYIELPLVLYYEFAGRTLVPYLQGGGFYGFSVVSTGNVSYTYSDPLMSQATEFIDETEYNNSSRFIKSNYGITGSAGMYYRFEKTKLGLEFAANMGLPNLANIKNRYGANNLTGLYYDAPDDLKMLNFSINIVYMVSLRWVERKKFSSFCN